MSTSPPPDPRDHHHPEPLPDIRQASSPPPRCLRATGPDGGEAKISAAGIASVLGERERALRLLREAFARGFGFSYYDHLQEQFEPLWSYPPYREFMRPKG